MRLRALLLASLIGAGCSAFGTVADEAATPSGDAGVASDGSAAADGGPSSTGDAGPGAATDAGRRAPCSPLPKLGNNLANGDSETTLTPDRLASFGFEGATTGPFNCVHVHIENITGAGDTDLVIGLYTEGSSKNPDALEATATIKNAKTGWNEAYLDGGPIVTKGTIVHFALVPASSNVEITLDAQSCDSNQRFRRDMSLETDVGSVSLPPTFAANGEGDEVCSAPIYLSD